MIEQKNRYEGVRRKDSVRATLNWGSKLLNLNETKDYGVHQITQVLWNNSDVDH